MLVLATVGVPHLAPLTISELREGLDELGAV